MTGLKKLYPYQPDYAVPPGETLRDTLESLKMTQAELAIRAELSTRMICQIISGEEPITYNTAEKLERATGVPASIWNKLESNYCEQKARQKNLEQMKKDIEWLKKIPVNELVKRNVIQEKDTKPEQLEQVLSFFGVSSVKAWNDLWGSPRRIAARKSCSFESKPEATATWIRLGELQVQQKRLHTYDKSDFRKILSLIKAMSANPEADFASKIVELCAMCGVCVIYVKEIPGAPWSGASWWHAGTPVIQLSLRYKTDDQFWFSFFHEAGHVLSDSKKQLFITCMYSNDDKIDQHERAANTFAANFLIPTEYKMELRNIKSEAGIIEFAKRLGISPGIVVGRMQHDGYLRFNVLNRLKKKLEWNK